MIQIATTQELRRQALTSALTLFLIALLFVAGEFAIHASGFLFYIPMPVVR